MSLVGKLILPLTGNSILTVGGRYYSTSYLSPTLDEVVVELFKTDKLHKLVTSSFYKRFWYVGKRLYIEYYIPSEFIDDVNLIVSGNYGKISKNAKSKIIETITSYSMGGVLDDNRVDFIKRSLKFHRNLVSFSVKTEHGLNLIVSPEVAGISDVGSKIRTEFNSSLSKTLGIKLPEDAELISKKELNELVVPEDIYKESEVCINYCKRTEYE
jgi:hypothetical protein